MEMADNLKRNCNRNGEDSSWVAVVIVNMAGKEGDIVASARINSNIVVIINIMESTS